MTEWFPAGSPTLRKQMDEGRGSSMTRIEEIKGRNERRKALMNDRKDEFVMIKEIEYQGLVKISVEDVQYLLSKLEIAEKALELAVNELDEHDRNEHMEHGDFCSEYKPCAELTAINEALRQIRE